MTGCYGCITSSAFSLAFTPGRSPLSRTTSTAAILPMMLLTGTDR
jgi:hypothetical protein